MIGRLLTELGGRVAHADVVATTDDTITVTRQARTAPIVEASTGAWVQVRVADSGRVGWAGGLLTDGGDIAAAALRSLAVSDQEPLLMPAPSPLPEVSTAAREVAGLGSDALLAVTESLADRLAGVGRTVEVWAERSVGQVEVANTRGVAAAYPASLVGVGVAVRLGDGTEAPLHLDLVQGRPPREDELAALGNEVEGLLRPPLLPFQPFRQRISVWFGPRAVRSLLAAILARHLGESWHPPAETVRYDERITLDDDPHAPYRPGSRPIDDDGVVTRRIRLVDRGRPVAGIADLRLASRAGRPSTGHGYRRGAGPPRVGFSNLELGAGSDHQAALGAAAGNGIYVPTIRLGPAANPIAGTFRAAAPWAYRLDRGEVVGRLDGCWLSGNVFDLLGRLVAVGDDRRWVGAARVPSWVVDGVIATAR
ncbi:MAG: hypothetical protein FJ206_16790 [Gemmatimonadetes bacterium]|nr:hypothetical protein [Gemmatimonadota bacterium]